MRIICLSCRYGICVVNTLSCKYLTKYCFISMSKIPKFIYTNDLNVNRHQFTSNLWFVIWNKFSFQSAIKEWNIFWCKTFLYTLLLLFLFSVGEGEERWSGSSGSWNSFIHNHAWQMLFTSTHAHWSIYMYLYAVNIMYYP